MAGEAGRARRRRVANCTVTDPKAFQFTEENVRWLGVRVSDCGLEDYEFLYVGTPNSRRLYDRRPVDCTPENTLKLQEQHTQFLSRDVPLEVREAESSSQITAWFKIRARSLRSKMTKSPSQIDCLLIDLRVLLDKDVTGYE
jgi:hypothetical protein